MDESSQCLEPNALIPILKFKCEKLLAVGDPNQLNPTLP
jgi:superfamily I DNA and/or RNA helicase